VSVTLQDEIASRVQHTSSDVWEVQTPTTNSTPINGCVLSGDPAIDGHKQPMSSLDAHVNVVIDSSGK
jgi:hypothetical protein